MIPAVNIAAVIHLGLIAAFIGIFMVESVLELYSAVNSGDGALHRAVIRLHFWIDLLVELPVFAGVVGSGIAMALLVDKLTPLHVIKISSVTLFFLIAVWCPVTVIKRYQMANEGAPEAALRAKSKTIIYLAACSMSIFFTAAFGLGLWLAYHRVLRSIYG
jgi:hypothetical protein